jgi:drug/metabolite transporter (DMT)-like permease
VVCAGLFAVRDTLVRWGSGDATLDPLVRTVASLAAAALVLAAWSYLTRRTRPPARLSDAIKPFLPAGLCLGAAYLCLIVALDRGRVTIVAPLNATQSLWGVIFAAAFLGKREAIGPRLLAAAVLVVAGGVLIGISR